MNDGRRPPLLDDLPQIASAAQIATFQRPPFHGPFVASLQIVEGNGQEAGMRQCLTGMAANESSPAGDQDRFHGVTPCNCSARSIGGEAYRWPFIFSAKTCAGS